MSAEEPGDRPAEPVLRIVSPNATPEEIAALVAVFSSLGGGEPSAPGPRSEWASPKRRMRTIGTPGPGAWKTSGLR